MTFDTAKATASIGNGIRRIGFLEEQAARNVARRRDRISRRVENRDIGIPGSKRLRHIPAIDLPAQPYVGEDDIDRAMSFMLRQCGFAAFGLQDNEARIAQMVRYGGSHEAFILHNEDGQDRFCR